jgi:hypothetical protein
MGDKKCTYNDGVRALGKYPPRRKTRKCENNTKTDPREIGCEGGR